jgi:mannose-6-phosphate isomerase-like protein (cupin superfamily)
MTYPFTITLVIIAASTLALSQAPNRQEAQQQTNTAAAKNSSNDRGAGLVLQAEEGERWVRRYANFRPDGTKGEFPPFILKVDPLNGGSKDLVMGMEDIPPGGSIPLHKHVHCDEILFIHRGEAVATLNGRATPVRTGGSVFVPSGVWITFKNTGQEPLSLVFIFSKPGFEQYLREGSVREGEKVIPFSPEELTALRRKNEWHTVYKNP